MKKKLRNSKFAYQYPYEIIALEIKLIFLNFHQHPHIIP